MLSIRFCSVMFYSRFCSVIFSRRFCSVLFSKGSVGECSLEGSAVWCSLHGSAVWCFLESSAVWRSLEGSAVCAYSVSPLCASAGFRRSLRLWRRMAYRGCRLSCSSCYSCSPHSTSLSNPYEEVVLYQRSPQENPRLIVLVGETFSCSGLVSTVYPWSGLVYTWLN